jgi:hypothetical protein
MTAGPPCTCSSRTSSPGTVRGAGKKRTSALESRMESVVGVLDGSYSVRTEARLGVGSGLPGHKEWYICAVCLAEMRRSSHRGRAHVNA